MVARLSNSQAGGLMDIAEEKRLARQSAAKRRAEAHARLSDMAGATLARRGLPAGLSLRSGIVSGFMPYKSEISTLPLLEALSGQGWQTVLPVVVAEHQPLIFRAWKPGEALEPGVWNIPVPPAGAAELDPDVLLVPMLAFDRLGYRLGYGGGFYDRTLEKLRRAKTITAIGVAYAAQQVDGVPRGDHDVPLDYVMTEEETFACG
jgi:5-formyltetrahydrofolate cyclo-ligase